MSKKEVKLDLMAMALQSTTANIVKGRGASGKTTYLDRFVNTLLDEDGNPIEPKERLSVIAEMTLEICQEQRESEKADDDTIEDFTLTAGRDTADDEIFAKVNNKVKNQVAAAIANNQNSTSVSFNEKYKNVWQVVKKGSKVSLAPADQDTDFDAA